MRTIGMPDVFSVVGLTVRVREKHGMSEEAIVNDCRELTEMQIPQVK